MKDVCFLFTQPHRTQQVTMNGVSALQDKICFNYMVHAAGFGIRYKTPIGPVRLDLAFSPNSSRFAGCAGYSGNQLLDCGKIDPQTKQQLLPRKNDRINPFQFHFSIGQAF